MSTKKILVTGGLGFIGTEVTKALVGMGRKVVLFDNLSPQIHGALPAVASSELFKHHLVEIIRGDVCGLVDWSGPLAGVDCIIHLAAETGTAQSMYQIARYTDANVGGTAYLLDYLANHRHQVKKMILASSRSVYGEGAYRCARCGVVYPAMRPEENLRAGQWEPFCSECGGSIEVIATSEDAKTSPGSIYAATKLAQEDLVRIACRALGIAAVIFRFQNVYGEGQSLKNPYTGILSIFSNQLRQGKTVNLYEDGEESRDFVHVSDVARAVIASIDSDRADGWTLNVGSGQATSVRRIALLLKEYLGASQAPVVSGQYRLGDIRHGFADLTTIENRLGFAPEVTLEEGLKRFIEWVKTQDIEPDLLGAATDELISRGLMPEHDVTKSAAV